MKLLLTIQTLGTMGVLISFAASEAAAHLLQAFPSNAALWRLNLGLFHAFEMARLQANPLNCLFGPASLTIGFVTILVLLALRFFEFRFGVALFANLAFLASALLAYRVIWAHPTSSTVEPIAATLATKTDSVLITGLLVSSFVAFAVSHLTFVKAIASARQPVTENRCTRNIAIGTTPDIRGRRVYV